MRVRFCCGVVLAGLLFSGMAFAAVEDRFKTEKEKVNYSIGVHLFNLFKQQGVDFDADLVLQGFSDGIRGNSILVSEDDLNKSIIQYQRAVRKKQTGKLKHNPAADNLRIGEKFLAENRIKPGVVVTKSGLQYRVVIAGTGSAPVNTSTVEYNYREMLLNRKEVASTAKKGKPEVTKLNGDLLPALQEALSLMKVGSKWELYVPANLAYGEEGKGVEVPPNSALIYEVELLAVK